MHEKWVKKDWIPKKATNLGSDGNAKKGYWSYTIQKGNTRKTVKHTIAKKLRSQGWELLHTTYRVPAMHYSHIDRDICKWYKKVFEYVTKWFKNSNYIRLKKGSFNGGFCAEVDAKRETVEHWGAPLVKNDNKVSQIKEKFGAIVVYLYSLSDIERQEVNKFAKHVEKKFDCKTRFV